AMPPERLADKPGSCGRPIRGVRLRIVDDEGRDLPPGATGEVLIAGPNVMLGYWNEPELTRETLRDGWLYTGDLGRVDDEGFLYLVGRKRDLIKCAGERISAVEIEEALLAHPGVLEASVTGAPHDVLGEIASAFVVRRDGTLSEADLRAWCAARLTHHKIPRAFTFLDELPKTASGKVQKHRLLGGA
ncbi:MAG: long-chain fatty acid--CoA ligase, partial [Acidobacteria bacterium]|nr:long-chain fatty acid--CoA ligase [Acidobacteriota bacterium]